MALRTHEIQNNAWDYHPLADVEGPYDHEAKEYLQIPEFLELDGKYSFSFNES